MGQYYYLHVLTGFEVASPSGWGNSFCYVLSIISILVFQQTVVVGFSWGCWTNNPDDLIDYVILITSVYFSG